MPTLKLGDRGLSYDDVGDGPPVVLLHGVLAHRGVFGRLADRLAAERRVINVDLRGHGASGPAEDYEIGSFSDDLERLLDALDLPAVTLLGWSMGGAIAIDFALRFPARVRQLVLVATTPALTQREDWAPAIPAAEAAHLIDLFGSDWDAGTAAFSAQAVHDATTAERARYLEMARASDPAVSLKCLAAVGGADLRPRLRRAEMPVAVLSGAQDRICPTGASEYLATALGGELHVIPASGHAPFLTAPEAFDAALDRVLRDGSRVR